MPWLVTAKRTTSTTCWTVTARHRPESTWEKDNTLTRTCREALSAWHLHSTTRYVVFTSTDRTKVLNSRHWFIEHLSFIFILPTSHEPCLLSEVFWENQFYVNAQSPTVHSPWIKVSSERRYPMTNIILKTLLPSFNFISYDNQSNFVWNNATWSILFANNNSLSTCLKGLVDMCCWTVDIILHE